MILFGKDQSLICQDRSALVCLASLSFYWLSEFEPDVDEISVELIVMGESNDTVEFKQQGVLPKESGDEEGNGKLNEDYDLHF